MHSAGGLDLADHRQEHLRILFRMVQTQIAMVVSGEDLQSAAQNRVIQQFSGCTDQGLLFAA